MSERPPPLRESLPLPGRGRLELRLAEGAVIYRPRQGSPRALGPHPIFGEPGRLGHAAVPDGRSLLFARHRSDRLHLFDAERLAFRLIPGFARLAGSEEQRLHALDDGYLVITENGIAALGADGREQWRIDRVTHGSALLAREPEVLWLRDGAGDVLAIERTSGRERLG